MENTQYAVSVIVDCETGEVRKEIYEGDRVRVIRSSQIEYTKTHSKEIQDDKVYNFGQDKNFSMLSEFSAKQLADEKLTGSEYRIILLMISMTNYKSGFIALGNNHPVTDEWISECLRLNIKTTERAIKNLIDRGIIAKTVTNFKVKYFFNPFIQYRGRWINKTLYEMFRNTKWAKR